MITDQQIEVILAVCNNTRFSLAPQDSMTFNAALMALKKAHSTESAEVVSMGSVETDKT